MKAISLFTGAGGMDVGFQRAGFDIVWANELMPYAVETYSQNHTKEVIHRGDLNALMDRVPKDNIFCVFGGPPCQGFSVAGKMDVQDARSQLVFSFMKVVEQVLPTVFVMENVKALASLTKFAHVREKLIDYANNYGYNSNFFILNAKDFGVPQSRERVFFIGFKKSSGINFSYEYFERHKKPSIPARDILTRIGRAGTAENPLTCKAKITLAERPVMRKSPYAGMMFNGLGRPINTDSVSCTLPASMGGNKTPIIDEGYVYLNKPSWIEWYHARLRNGEPPLGTNDVSPLLRRLTLKEAAALQTFPEDYKFVGSISSQYAQIGNAVPCQLAYAVAASLMDAINKFPIKIKEAQGILALN